MIRYHEALAFFKAEARLLKTEEVLLCEAMGRILASDIDAPMSLPSYDNSAMDGYAVHHQETTNAHSDNPIVLKQIARLGAGEYLKPAIDTQKMAVEIMTGAPIPAGFDAVIPVENIASREMNAEKYIDVTESLSAGQNIRYAGEDIKKNDLLLSRGNKINAQRIMTLAGVGIRSLTVYQKPHIMLIATGKELAKDAHLDERYQLHDCNSPFLNAALSSKYQAKINTQHLYNDTDEDFIALIQTTLSAECCPDLIISTGAVSAGRYDFIPRSLLKLGARIIFHKVAIRPGKPVLFAVLPNGTLYLGLPGNPAAVAAGFTFFVDPLLRQCQQRAFKEPSYAYLDNTIQVKAALCFFQKAFYYFDETGQARVTVLPGQASFMIQPLLHTNAWVMIDNGPQEIEKNTRVPFFPI